MKIICFLMILLWHSSSRNAGTEISGKIVDTAGNAVAGANILIKGTPIGVVTDYDGKFTLRFPEAPLTLYIAFIGYKSLEQKVTLQGTWNMEVTLVPDTKKNRKRESSAVITQIAP